MWDEIIYQAINIYFSFTVFLITSTINLFITSSPIHLQVFRKNSKVLDTHTKKEKRKKENEYNVIMIYKKQKLQGKSLKRKEPLLSYFIFILDLRIFQMAQKTIIVHYRYKEPGKTIVLGETGHVLDH